MPPPGSIREAYVVIRIAVAVTVHGASMRRRRCYVVYRKERGGAMVASQARMAIVGVTVMLGVSLSCAGAALAGVPRQYVLHHPGREHCRAHYVKRHIKRKRRVHGRTVTLRETVCVREAPKRRANGAVKVEAKLDPAYKQSPANPLAVTYTYSASATETVEGTTIPKTDLPNGILNLYSDGLLACSKAVGGNVTGGECAVTYSALGSHAVIVTYSAGTLAGTVTEVEHIEAFSTQTTLHVSGPSECGTRIGSVELRPGETTGSIEIESCTYTAALGTVDENGNLPPNGGIVLAFEVLPAEVFRPGIDPSALRFPGGFFTAPVSFTLERLHGPNGWKCGVKSGSHTSWGNVTFIWNPHECGTSVFAYAEYRYFPLAELWSPSKSARYPVTF
jgi:hypothetical protein